MGPTPPSDLAQQERTRREILHRSDLIRPLPDLVVRVLGLLSDDRTETADLEQHLQVDQVIVAKLLGLVNSPLYGLQRPITTVRTAITVLGFRGLRSLLLASHAAKLMSRDLQAYGYGTHGMLQHSFGVGSAARDLGGLVGMSSDLREELFVAGLLHDIGKLLLVGWLEKAPYDPLRLGHDVSVLERETIGIDHSECGALVAAKWNLTAELQEILKRHHDDEHPGPAHPMLAMVRIADAWAHECGLGLVPEVPRRSRLLQSDLRLVGLHGARLEEAKVTMQRAFDTAVETLRTFTC